MAYYKNKYGQLTSTYGLVGDNYEAEEADARKAALARSAEASAADIGSAANQSQEARARTAAQAQIDAANIQAEAQKEVERIRQQNRRYKNGGPVIKGEFKHANSTYTKFGQTGDSSLLAKGRK